MIELIIRLKGVEAALKLAGLEASAGVVKKAWQRIAELESKLEQDLSSWWVSVDDRSPPDRWEGLVITDARPDKPVMAHTSNEYYRFNFPYSDRFLGKWREAILTGDHMRESAKITYWLETKKLYPHPPIEQEQSDSGDQENE